MLDVRTSSNVLYYNIFCSARENATCFRRPNYKVLYINPYTKSKIDPSQLYQIYHMKNVRLAYYCVQNNMFYDQC